MINNFFKCRGKVIATKLTILITFLTQHRCYKKLAQSESSKNVTAVAVITIIYVLLTQCSSGGLAKWDTHCCDPKSIKTSALNKD